MSQAWQSHSSRDRFVSRNDGLNCARGIVWGLKWMLVPWVIVLYVWWR